MQNESLFPHKTFLHQNAIEIGKLPEALQKRIYGFEELEQDLLTTIDGDRDQLLSRMEDLSHELDEDLEEHFEDQIDNNDQQEEGLVESATAPSAPPEHECACKHAKHMEHENNETLHEEAPVPTEPTKDHARAPESKPQKKDLSDEEILAALVEGGWHKILPDDLRSKGFKAPLNFKVIAVGKYYLRRGRYESHYRIMRAWD